MAPPAASSPDWRALALEVDPPAIIYDASALEAAVEELHADLTVVPGAELAFAVKANRSPGVLRTLARAGVGADVASVPELRAAQAAGMRPIHATAPAFGAVDLKDLVAAGARPDLDGMTQLRTWSTAFPDDRQIGLRIRAPVPPVEREHDGGRRWSRFGVDVADPALHEALAELGLEVVQLHIHAGEMANPERVALIGEVLEAATQLFPGTMLLNVGGGLAALYGDDERVGSAWTALGASVARIGAQLGRAPRVVVEPGMLVAAMAGVLVTEVRAVETPRGAEAATVTVDASAWALMPWSVARVLDAVPERSEAPSLVDVAGSSCYERDWLVIGARCPLPRPGDRLVISAAGAYVTSMARNVHGVPLPDEWILDGGRLERATFT
ncbi:MAG: hypothetical protein AVDCRST_MAG85-1727 [uncultured Solirubrobacteraceae bacterium]|uniref:Diaminopimelate decarboxylase n=1 Tax=uncultured Solirubrobacteraceae bacterium TaxID=1162706 RepID=A0A6J4SPD6_9ACTN|nr:MAG: hypothetical protein AVDCRST_MAG85-1727 [uncultured Solirubrobacteraceae bacterium]